MSGTTILTLKQLLADVLLKYLSFRNQWSVFVWLDTKLIYEDT